MKKIGIILLAMLFVMGKCKKETPQDDSSQAHFKVKLEDGTIVSNNQEFTYNTTDATANLVLLIQNTTSNTIKLKTQLTDVTGTDGNQMEFCFGNCYMGMRPLTEYPENADFTVAGNSTTQPDAVHYHNHDSNACTYTIKIYEVDGDGNQVGDALTFKYIKQ